jgi:hypothetical protein
MSLVDINDLFRYAIVIEDTTVQKDSITSDVTSYYVKDFNNNKVYRIIDTPGFADTSGVVKDK